MIIFKINRTIENKKKGILTDSLLLIIQKHYEFYLISEQDSILLLSNLTNPSKSFKSAIRVNHSSA